LKQQESGYEYVYEYISVIWWGWRWEKNL